MKIIYSVLFAALISVCAFFSVPIAITPVPLVLQNMMAVLSGQILGSLYGGIAVLIFLILGAIGFPVFSGGGGGIARFVSPTGGFLIGYLLASVISGLFFINREKDKFSYLTCLISSFFGFITIYIPGIAFFMISLQKTFMQAIVSCFIPFVIPDLIKMFLASFISYKTKPVFNVLSQSKNQSKEKD